MRIAAFLLILVISGCSLPRWPVHAPVGSPFGLRFLGLRPDFHHGIDLSVPVGTPVTAMNSGSIEFAGEMRGYGLTVILRHSPHLRTLYAHLSEIAVRKGDAIKGGAILGKSGQTGNVTGPHLHFEIQRWGKDEDPVEMLGGLPQRGNR